MTPSDTQLITSFLEGSADAREALLARWLPPVLDWCVRLGGPKVDPEDAAHDVFIVVLTKLDTLDDPDRFRPWLFGITRRILDRHRRRAWVRRWVPGLFADPPSQRPDPEATTATARDVDTLVTAVDALPAALREVVVLSQVEERPLPEVAELVGVPLGTVKSRLRLARQKLQRDPRLRALHLAGVEA